MNDELMDENTWSVYKHIFPNGKCYIGITSRDPEKRWKANGRGYTKDQPRIYNAIKKYGWDNVIHEILYTNLSESEAKQKEIELIQLFQSNNDQYGYNIDNGGNGPGKISDETREKLRRANTGKKASEETKEKLRQSHLGKKQNEKTIQKRSRAMMGFKHTSEAKRKIGDAHKGKGLTDEHKNKLSESHKGKHLSDEAKKKMSQNLSKGVCQLGLDGSFIREFDSVMSANEYLGKANSSAISAVCKGKRKSAYGYKWKYTTDTIQND